MRGDSQKNYCLYNTRKKYKSIISIFLIVTLCFQTLALIGSATDQSSQSNIIKIHTPSNGQIIRDEITIWISVSPQTNNEKPEAEIKINDGPWQNLQPSQNIDTYFMYKWDTTTVSDGGYTIYVRTYDGEKYEYKSIYIIVQNQPVDVYFQTNISVDKKVENLDAITAEDGETLEFKITIVNTGGTTYHRLQVLDYLPFFLKYEEDANHKPYVYNESQNIIGWDFDNCSLKRGDCIEITYHATILPFNISHLKDILGIAAWLRLLGAQIIHNPLTQGLQYLAQYLQQIGITFKNEPEDNISSIGEQLAVLGIQMEENISSIETADENDDQTLNNLAILGSQIQQHGETLREMITAWIKPLLEGNNVVEVRAQDDAIALTRDQVLIKKNIERKLHIVYLYSHILEEESFLVQVIDELHNPVDNAMVEFDNKNEETNIEGMTGFLTPKVNEDTNFTLKVSKQGFASNDILICVKNSPSDTNLDENVTEGEFYLITLNEANTVIDSVAENTRFYVIAINKTGYPIVNAHILFNGKEKITNEYGNVEFTAPLVKYNMSLTISATKGDKSTSTSIKVINQFENSPTTTTLNETGLMAIVAISIATIIGLLLVLLYRHKSKKHKPTIHQRNSNNVHPTVWSNKQISPDNKNGKEKINEFEVTKDGIDQQHNTARLVDKPKEENFQFKPGTKEKILSANYSSTDYMNKRIDTLIKIRKNAMKKPELAK